MGPALRRLEHVDWESWVPQDRATLLFVVRDGQVLLIRKKRGLGAGKINGPGGRISPGETSLAAAVREVHEEVGLTPLGVEQRGEIGFQFTDGYSIEVSIFRASDCEGVPIETEEAAPLWCDLGEIPYGEMWADDAHWLPWLLEGRNFRGRALFDGDRMLGHTFELLPGDFRWDPKSL